MLPGAGLLCARSERAGRRRVLCSERACRAQAFYVLGASVPGAGLYCARSERAGRRPVMCSERACRAQACNVLGASVSGRRALLCLGEACRAQGCIVWDNAADWGGGGKHGVEHMYSASLCIIVRLITLVLVHAEVALICGRHVGCRNANTISVETAQSAALRTSVYLASRMKSVMIGAINKEGAQSIQLKNISPLFWEFTIRKLGDTVKGESSA